MASTLSSSILSNTTKLLTTTAKATPTPTPIPAAYMTWQSWLTAVCIFIMLVVLSLRIYPSCAVVLTTLAFLWCCTVIPEKDALAGWASSGLITVMALFPIMDTVLNGYLLRRGIGVVMGTGARPLLALIRQMTVFATVSAFLNNTPLVALMVPISKEWARKYGLAPSKFLMAHEFAITSGGMCTVVGTSTSVIVQGLLNTDASKNPNIESMGFFDIGAAGLPATIVALVYLALIGYRLLPDEKGGLFRHTQEHGGKFLMQFVIPEGHEWVGRQVLSTISARYPPDEAKVLELIRPAFPGSSSAMQPVNASNQNDPGGLPATPVPDGFDIRQSHNESEVEMSPMEGGGRYLDAGSRSTEGISLLSQEATPVRRIFPVEAEEVFVAGDTIVLSLNSHTAALSAHQRSSVPELRLLSRRSMRGVVRDLVEAVISDTNPLVGQHPTNAQVSQHYADTILVAVRHRGETIAGQSDLSSSHHLLSAGDTILLMVKPELVSQLEHSRDFFVVSRLSNHAEKAPLWKEVAGILIILGVFAAILSQDVVTELAAIVGACVICLLRLNTAGKMIETMDGDLFVLIGASIGVGTCIADSGMSNAIGYAISRSGISAESQLVIVYLVTLCITEIVTNNAAATIMYPIAKSVAQASNLNVKTFAMVVAMAASSSHMIPIGYQCHLMVLGPGGYTMKDFCKVGFGMNVIFFVLTIGIMPAVWPLEK